jgi:uncharacterized repeat protein (TIGR03803 family)
MTEPKKERTMHLNPVKSIRIAATLLALFMVFAGVAATCQAQTFTTLSSFGVTDGHQSDPVGQLAQGRDGNLYGTLNDNNTLIYQITPAGAFTLLWDSGTDLGHATVCITGMTVGTDGLLYGTCQASDSNITTSGVIFKYDPSQGQNGFTILHTYPPFGVEYSENPSPLTLGTDGNFYGTTGGDAVNTYGTVFRITPGGTYTTLHAFLSGSDGAYPSAAPLTLGTDGNFYGTTDQGGLSNTGTIYRITPRGSVKILHAIANAIGPLSGVIQGLDGNFYGQTFLGGPSNFGLIYKVTPGGKFTALHGFNQTTDHAAYPLFPLELGTDGNLYGASEDYAHGGFGPESLYEFALSGHYSDLYSGFPTPPCSGSGACIPSSPLLLHTNGVFFGVSAQGGSIGRGTFYSLNTGLASFVRLQLAIGKAGASIGIFGQGFSQASAVSFNGTSANFTVISDTYMTGTVPAGATTGYVTVSEALGSLQSNVPFTVKP